MNPMKKILSLCISIITFAALVYTVPASAAKKEQEDRGPLTKKVFIHYKKPKAKPDRVTSS